MSDDAAGHSVPQTGLGLFTLGSLLCGLAPGLPWLIAFRVVQAVGASMLNPVAMSIITNTFDEPRERARAIGAWGAVMGVAMAVGPMVGGALLAVRGALTTEAPLFAAYLLIGIGVGLANTPVTNAAMSGMPKEQAGVAAAIVSTSRQFGQALGVAVLGAVLTTGLHRPGTGFAQAVEPAYWIITACGLAIVLLALTTTRRTAGAERIYAAGGGTVNELGRRRPRS